MAILSISEVLEAEGEEQVAESAEKAAMLPIIVVRRLKMVGLPERMVGGLRIMALEAEAEAEATVEIMEKP
jgi:hypothetical protein